MARPRVRRGYVRTESEAAFQQALINFLVALGWRYYHTHRSDRSVPGFPDLVLVRRERLIFAELKAEKGVVSGPQQEWLDALEVVAGAVAEAAAIAEAEDWPGTDVRPSVEVYVWRPSDWPEIEVVLR